MSNKMRRKVAVAICALAFLIPSVPGHAQEQQHMPTIADCPPGYRLAVQDTEYAMPLGRVDNQNGYSDPRTAQAADQAYQADQAAAPRAFVTGCVPRQPVQQQQQYGGYQ